jgi:hypothetical protein
VHHLFIGVTTLTLAFSSSELQPLFLPDSTLFFHPFIPHSTVNMPHNLHIDELNSIISKLVNTLRKRSDELQAQEQEIQHITELLLDVIVKLAPHTSMDDATLPHSPTQTDSQLDSQWPDALKDFYQWGRDARGSPTFVIDPDAEKSSVTESDESFEPKLYRSPLQDQRNELFQIPYNQIIEQKSLLNENGNVVRPFLQLFILLY